MDVTAGPAATVGAAGSAPRAAGMDRAVTLGALLCGMISVQIGASLAKTLFPVLGAAHAGALRILFASLLLLPLVWQNGRPRSRRGGGEDRAAPAPRRRAIGAVAIYGVTMGVMNVVFYLALARLPLGIVVAIEFMGPLSLALAGSRRPLDLLWVGFAVSGLLLLLQPWRLTHRLDPLGVALAVGAALTWAAYILAGRRLGRHVSGVTATALGMGVAALVTLPISLPALPLLRLQGWLLPAALGMALLSSAVPYSIEMMAMRRMSMRGFSILMSLEPALAAIAGLLLLGEQLSPLRWLAIGGIVAASLGSAATDRPPPASGTPPTGP